MGVGIVLHAKSSISASPMKRLRLVERKGRLLIKYRCSSNLKDKKKYKKLRVSAVREVPVGFSSIPVQTAFKRPRMACQSVMKNNVNRDKNDVMPAYESIEPHQGKAKLIGKPSQESEHSQVVDELIDSYQIAPINLSLPDLEEGRIYDVQDDSHEPLVFESTYADSRVKPLPNQESVKVYRSSNSYQVDFVPLRGEIALQSHSISLPLLMAPSVLDSNPLRKTPQKNYPCRRKVSAKRDFPPYVQCNAPLPSRKETDKVVASVTNMSTSVEEVPQVDTWENKKDEYKNEAMPINESVEPGLKEAKLVRRLSLELENSEVGDMSSHACQVAGFGSVRKGPVKFSSTDLEEAEIYDEQGDSREAFVLKSVEVFNGSNHSHQEDFVAPKTERAQQNHLNSLPLLNLPTVSLSMPVCKTVGTKYPKRRNVSAKRDFPPFVGSNFSLLNMEEVDKVVASSVKNGITSAEKFAYGDEGDNGRKTCRRITGNWVDGKLEILRVTTEKDNGFLKENRGNDIMVYNGAQSPKRELLESSGFMNQLPQENSDTLDFTHKETPQLTDALDFSRIPEKMVYKQSPADVTHKREEKGFDFGCFPQPGPVQKLTKRKQDDAEWTSSSKGQSSNKKAYKEYPCEPDFKLRNLHIGQKHPKFSKRMQTQNPIGSGFKDTDNDASRMRKKVQETLRLFQDVYGKLLQEKEARKKNSCNRIDFEARKIVTLKDKLVNPGKPIIGSVPGVKVGDAFRFKMELNIIGLHRSIMGGIDYVKKGSKILAASVVASRMYDDDLDSSDVLIYTGQGGNVMDSKKKPEDQKLERGNLALANSLLMKNLVRVIRDEAKSLDSLNTRGKSYVYDGLYLVEESWQEIGRRSNLVFKFRLRRIPGQPELARKTVNKSVRSKFREYLQLRDISNGKERVPISVFNTIDDEKLPYIIYTTKMIYPDWCRSLSPQGCGCTTNCSRSIGCLCARKNGGGIPYNHDGAIVEEKPLVFECGPHCKCPPSCYNRVSQKGVKFRLEVFKTDLRGWGVRSLEPIPSGSFICEYVGQLLEENEAEKRIGHDEYLFDIGSNNDNEEALWSDFRATFPKEKPSSWHVNDRRSGFTIDAAQHGNVGRFINHSCSPNLYAQNVLFDHWDERMPHIMFFATENIPQLQELTYHYNYSIDQVCDSSGNIKKKECYCGSSRCKGRLY